MKHAILLGLFLGGMVLVAQAQRIALSWPTPNHAFDEGKPIAAILQQAGSGDPASGGFGGVRSNGRQFHEGIDIQPVEHDRRGEPEDPVFAAMDGVVRYVNNVAGNSSYGRYIVLEHPELRPAVYTLYAHLAHIAPHTRPGVTVRRGETLGIMGHSSGGYVIPKTRAHLHFEMGVRLSDDFQSWYDWKRFGSRNEHGNYNGYNLMGFDPLDFFREYKAHRVDNFQEYFARMPVVVTVRIATLRVPDFVRRYPSLVTKHGPMLIAGWEVGFDWTGLPCRWTPLDAAAVKGMRPNQVQILSVDAATEKREKSKVLVVSRRGQWEPGEDLLSVLQLLFGLRR
jgi:hypothetical protein